MGILFSEVKYYVSEHRSDSDASQNGGRVGDQIVNDTLHSIFNEISATERENGLTRFSKVFVFNESSSRVMKDCIFYIKQDVLPPDRLKLYEATEKLHITFENTDELLGSSSAVAAGTSIAIENIYPAGTVAGDLVGRSFMIDTIEYTVASSADDSHIALDKDITVDILANTTFSTVDDYDFMQSDEDFVAGKKYINSVIRSTVSSGTTNIYIPTQDKDLFEVGDDVIICDGYFRAVYRGGIQSITDHQSDPELAVVELNKAFGSTVTIPTNEGYLANGFKKTLSPGEGKSFWIELDISPSDAIDAEIINQFQIGTHFDDISAS